MFQYCGIAHMHGQCLGACKVQITHFIPDVTGDHEAMETGTFIARTPMAMAGVLEAGTLEALLESYLELLQLSLYSLQSICARD